MLCKQAASHTFCVPGVIYESIQKGNNSVLRRGYVKLWDWEVAQLTQYNFPTSPLCFSWFTNTGGLQLVIHIPAEADGGGGRKYNHCLCINLMSLKGSYLETSYSLTTFCKSQSLNWAASPQAPGDILVPIKWMKNNIWGAGHLFSISCHRDFLQIALYCKDYRQCIRTHVKGWAVPDTLPGALRSTEAAGSDHHHTQHPCWDWGLIKTKPSICTTLF